MDRLRREVGVFDRLVDRNDVTWPQRGQLRFETRPRFGVRRRRRTSLRHLVRDAAQAPFRSVLCNWTNALQRYSSDYTHELSNNYTTPVIYWRPCNRTSRSISRYSRQWRRLTERHPASRIASTTPAAPASAAPHHNVTMTAGVDRCMPRRMRRG